MSLSHWRVSDSLKETEEIAFCLVDQNVLVKCIKWDILAELYAQAEISEEEEAEKPLPLPEWVLWTKDNLLQPIQDGYKFLTSNPKALSKMLTAAEKDRLQALRPEAIQRALEAQPRRLELQRKTQQVVAAVKTYVRVFYWHFISLFIRSANATELNSTTPVPASDLADIITSRSAINRLDLILALLSALLPSFLTTPITLPFSLLFQLLSLFASSLSHLWTLSKSLWVPAIQPIVYLQVLLILLSIVYLLS
ncbi:hypothetical protein BCR34DRAFT_634638 [Clohesyomyces aquaticus]|uniref:Uncharacterized protein n=1 Tax=Clohesyomyces aquaticus TaxID=1231657 RepID=A0A1Y1Z1E2_9PLEO|nr:hypothetical protein BCR34DRAFT_634638 [Clohesyomyces aquaticus]